jgi:hypothetical protein
MMDGNYLRDSHIFQRTYQHGFEGEYLNVIRVFIKIFCVYRKTVMVLRTSNGKTIIN